MDLSHALRTTGAARTFTNQHIDDATLFAILDDARFAPSGGNRQPWRVVVVREPAIREGLAELMRPVWDEYVGASATGVTPFAFGVAVDAAPIATPNVLLDHILEVPVVLAVAADLHRVALMDADLDRPPITGGASVYPFCWSVLLAARARGLGGVITTFLSRVEAEAAPLLGLPEGHALAATIFLGVPEHQPTRLRRHSVDSFATLDRFDGNPFVGDRPASP
jgi:nitroreductase